MKAYGQRWESFCDHGRTTHSSAEFWTRGSLQLVLRLSTIPLEEKERLWRGTLAPPAGLPMQGRPAGTGRKAKAAHFAD